MEQTIYIRQLDNSCSVYKLSSKRSLDSRDMSLLSEGTKWDLAVYANQRDTVVVDFPAEPDSVYPHVFLQLEMQAIANGIQIAVDNQIRHIDKRAGCRVYSRLVRNAYEIFARACNSFDIPATVERFKCPDDSQVNTWYCIQVRKNLGGIYMHFDADFLCDIFWRYAYPVNSPVVQLNQFKRYYTEYREDEPAGSVRTILKLRWNFLETGIPLETNDAWPFVYKRYNLSRAFMEADMRELALAISSADTEFELEKVRLMTKAFDKKNAMVWDCFNAIDSCDVVGDDTERFVCKGYILQYGEHPIEAKATAWWYWCKKRAYITEWAGARPEFVEQVGERSIDSISWKLEPGKSVFNGVEGYVPVPCMNSKGRPRRFPVSTMWFSDSKTEVTKWYAPAVDSAVFR